MPTETTETIVETTQPVVETTAPVTVPTEETTVPTTEAIENTVPDETTIPEETHEISETVAYISTEGVVLEDDAETVQETVPMTTEPMIIDIIETSSSNIVHASLFGSFLICGTLVGIFLLRGRYGT